LSIENSPLSKKKKDDRQTEEGSNVVYLGRIPHGFFEKQMKGFFSQFGDVKRLRLSRNRKSGKSKHYAFIEFAHEETANVVAETMNGYLLYGHRLVCKVLQKQDIHPNIWKGAGKIFKVIPWKKINKKQHNQPKQKAQIEKQTKRILEKARKKRKNLAELGIDYDFSNVACGVEETTEKKKRKTKTTASDT